MEEQVGAIWHRLITRWADDRDPAAAVALAPQQSRLALLFRALGGDPGLRIESADATTMNHRRRWLQRLAGSHQQVVLAWLDERALRLPAVIDHLPSRDLNWALYRWLVALAAVAPWQPRHWLAGNLARTRLLLQRFPGLRESYQQLLTAHLSQRPDPATLPPLEGQRERIIQAALQQPLLEIGGSPTGEPLALSEPTIWNRSADNEPLLSSALAMLTHRLDPVEADQLTIDLLPTAPRAATPLPLWLHPAPPRSQGDRVPLSDSEGDQGARDSAAQEAADQRRRQAQRVEQPEQERGLLALRMENILSWGEMVSVDRSLDDEEDLQRAEQMAQDMEQLAVARQQRRTASRLRFDLDLPAAASDDLPLGGGILLPEWDWQRAALRPRFCRVQPLLASDTQPQPLPPHLRRSAHRLRQQFQLLAPARVWHRAQPEGSDIDLDSWLRHLTDRAAGHNVAADRLYREMRSGSRDLACLLLADLSLSTDTFIDDERRVIDVIRDTLLLFGESLAATGDRFAIYGFSSRRRDPVRLHLLKGFSERYSDHVRGRIAAIKPGYYTRFGAAIRYTTRLLLEQGSGRRLLLLLTDGKPNDLDQYEGRYGIEDTRMAVREARRAGLEPFCVTIDRRGNDYLPHLFGSGGYVVIHKPSQLPARLPLLYARLAG